MRPDCFLCVFLILSCHRQESMFLVVEQNMHTALEDTVSYDKLKENVRAKKKQFYNEASLTPYSRLISSADLPVSNSLSMLSICAGLN